jgi:outer membrane protein
MRRFIVFSAVALTFIAGNAKAESIKGRLGITGQLGFIVPDNSRYTADFVNSNGLATDTLKADGGFTGGGGLIYGLTDNWALDAHVLYSPQNDYKNQNNAKVLEIDTIDASLGIQYRNNVSQDFAAYLGGGVDVLVSGVKDGSGHEGDIDTVVGGNINAGADYFLTKYFALNLEFRGIFAPEADIKAGGVTVAKYDPISYTGLIGVRWFLY